MVKRLRQLLSKGLSRRGAVGGGAGACRWVKRVSAVVGQRSAALGPADGRQLSEILQSDATGGGDDPCAGVGEPATDFVKASRGTGRDCSAARRRRNCRDEGRPGTLVRQPPLPRTSCQWPESRPRGGSCWVRWRALWLGDRLSPEKLVLNAGYVGRWRQLRADWRSVVGVTATTTLPTRPIST